MFGDNKNKEATKGKVETILGTGTKVEGDIHTNGSLRIEGEVIGNIKAEGDLFVGEEGRIETEIEARNVVIAGKVKGDVKAHQRLEILPQGKLIGDIKTDKLKIEEGAVFVGKSQTLKNEKDNVTKMAKDNKKVASTDDKN